MCRVNNWKVINSCPVCGKRLNQENILYVFVDYYNNEGKLMENARGVMVPICSECHPNHETGDLTIKFNLKSHLIIEHSEKLTTYTHSSSLTQPIRCACCGKEPHELQEYVDRAKEEPEYFSSAQDVVTMDDGTYNIFTGGFYCTPCYIKIGQPSGKCQEIYEEYVEDCPVCGEPLGDLSKCTMLGYGNVHTKCADGLPKDINTDSDGF